MTSARDWEKDVDWRLHDGIEVQIPKSGRRAKKGGGLVVEYREGAFVVVEAVGDHGDD